MPTADTTLQVTEQEIVERWRAQELERAGFPEDMANELAMRSDVDLHAAIDLIRRGCAPELAAQFREKAQRIAESLKLALFFRPGALAVRAAP